MPTARLPMLRACTVVTRPSNRSSRSVISSAPRASAPNKEILTASASSTRCGPGRRLGAGCSLHQDRARLGQ